MPYKIVNISSIRDHVGKWNVLAWSALKTGSNGLLSHFLICNPFWPFPHHLNSDMETPWKYHKLAVVDSCFLMYYPPNNRTHKYSHNWDLRPTSKCTLGLKSFKEGILVLENANNKMCERGSTLQGFDILSDDWQFFARRVRLVRTCHH